MPVLFGARARAALLTVDAAEPAYQAGRHAAHAEVRAWAADNQVELVFLPAYGSWLNWIESEFAALRYFTLNGTDHRSHAEQNAAIAGYVRHHNKQARPKTNFAQSSPIRSWTSYPAKAA